VTLLFCFLVRSRLVDNFSVYHPAQPDEAALEIEEYAGGCWKEFFVDM
jgi:hypothetical protein